MRRGTATALGGFLLLGALVTIAETPLVIAVLPCLIVPVGLLLAAWRPDWLPIDVLPEGRERLAVLLLVLAPHLYAAALGLLFAASPNLAGLWVAPSLPAVTAMLPVAEPLIRGHAAAGQAALGQVTVHLMAVALPLGLAACLLAVITLARAAAPARRAGAGYPILLVPLCLAFGLGVLWMLVMSGDVLDATGHLKGGRNPARMPGMAFILLIQFAFVALAMGVLVLLSRIAGLRDASARPTGRPPSGA